MSTMTRLPNAANTNSEIFTLRISPKLKEKLSHLTKKQRFGGSASSAIRYMIEYHSKR